MTMRNGANPDFIKQLQGYSLATAEILYHLPDHRNLLQTFVWQEYDLAPLFPNLKKFLDFWRREIEGPLHSVRVCHTHLIRPAEMRLVDCELTIH